MRTKQLCKRFFLSLLLILLMFGMPGSGSAQATTSLRISPTFATLTTCPSTELEIAVRVENVTALTAYHLEISFTPGVVEVLEVRNGTFLESGLMETTNAIDNLNGIILFGMAQMSPSIPQTGSGDLVIIRMKAIAPFLTTQFEIDALNSILVNWPEAQGIPFHAFGGTVATIGCDAFNTYLPMILN